MQSRRSQQKSRNGCTQCKARKIKCDEKRPICSACFKRSMTCTFAGVLVSQNEHVAAANSNAVAIPANFGTSEILRLELMHHFVTETVPSIAPMPERQLIMSTSVVKLAFSFPFLMHGILALSAQHMAYLKGLASKDSGQIDTGDGQVYARIAAEHHDLALSGYRRTIVDITEANSVALFAYSSLLLVFVMSAMAQENLSNPPTFIPDSSSVSQYADIDVSEEASQVGEWMHHLFGIRSMLDKSSQWIAADGSFSPLFPLPPDTQMVPKDIEFQLWRLQEFCKQTVDGDDAVQVYERANEELRIIFAWSYSYSEKFIPSIVFAWVSRIPYGYSNLLKMRRQEALALLATYCLLVHGLDDYWFCRGIGRSMIIKVDRLLPESEKHWARWAAKRMGLSEEISEDVLSDSLDDFVDDFSNY